MKAKCIDPSTPLRSAQDDNLEIVEKRKSRILKDAAFDLAKG
jgi:hypothetical protein